jgi:hypothetical protein
VFEQLVHSMGKTAERQVLSMFDDCSRPIRQTTFSRAGFDCRMVMKKWGQAEPNKTVPLNNPSTATI